MNPDNGHTAAALQAMDDEQDTTPSFLSMVKLVAIGVIVTILVFFAIGYIFGRLFL
ncbi:MAG TPA: hypothetical protein VG405_07945 [Solirubrobacteraceae bacterium]|jgi:hypothetical protein|nr:hypothetical protein [Solirubrobacteraceae bacterium]